VAADVPYSTNMNIRLNTTDLDTAIGLVPVGSPSSRVLTACAILCSHADDPNGYPADETDAWSVPGGEALPFTVPSAHLNTVSPNPYPYGGNHGYLDGSVRWVSFEYFICRAGPPINGAHTPGADFYW
jgi:hypothetical protein